MREQREFLLASLQDNQSTVRAVDVKNGALLVAALSPVPLLGRVFSHIEKISSNIPGVWPEILCGLFLLAWVLAIVSLVRGLGAIDNPAAHIVNANKATGVFYSGGLFRLRLWDVFVNSPVVSANKDITTFMENLPKTDKDVVRELAFEVMKVVYIREIKLLRLKWAYVFLSGWFVSGVSIYLISRYFSA